MLEQPKAGLISRFYRQVENRLKNQGTLERTFDFEYSFPLLQFLQI